MRALIQALPRRFRQKQDEGKRGREGHHDDRTQDNAPNGTKGRTHALPSCGAARGAYEITPAPYSLSSIRALGKRNIKLAMNRKQQPTSAMSSWGVQNANHMYVASLETPRAQRRLESMPNKTVRGPHGFAELLSHLCANAQSQVRTQSKLSQICPRRPNPR